MGSFAHATGYYNFGMHWKGALNTYHLGGVSTFQTGYTSGLNSGSTQGNGDGGLYAPNKISLDSSGNLYVSDANSRVSKFDSSGTFQGWIGAIGTSPTGGAAGCAGAAAGTATPGWCKGGVPTAGSADGMFNGVGQVAIDSSGNLYVVDGNARIQKFNSSGVFQGWIGKIATSPTGGAAGCAGAAAGTVTPGWCKGGSSTTGTGDGMFLGAVGIAIDASGNMYVVDRDAARVDKFNVSTGAFIGWVGTISTSPTGGAAGCAGAAVGTYTPGWCTGGTSASGTGDGMLDSPQGAAVDSAGNLYVADFWNARINKYSSSGTFLGWIGLVGFSSPTGGAAGCAGLGQLNLTPGWCLGGTSEEDATTGGLHGPAAIAIDSSGNLYVADSFNYRLNKYDSSGAFQGWISDIGTSPTGGAPGCNGAPINTLTPGWCTGGMSQDPSGSGDGMMGMVEGIAVDSAGNVYAADASHNRINRYNSTGAFTGALQSIAVFVSWTHSNVATGYGSGDGVLSYPMDVTLDSSKNLYVLDSGNARISKYNSAGAFVGWTGKVATSPSGGAAGCSGASVGAAAPGWCTGGKSASGSGDGMMWNPSGFALDSSGNIFVADSTNHRIDKFNASGVFVGWIGKIATSPTGGDPGCSGKAAGNFTPGWCKGGTGGSGTGDGMLSSPSRITIDSSGNLYVADTGNNRISMYNSAGAFQGWIGRIATSPTGGAAGCSGATVGTFTPGWCKGGTAASGTGDGMMSSPHGIVLDQSGNFYVNDSNGRINKYNSSGAFLGWAGKVGTSPTGGAAGCNGAAVGAATPGWCTGGTSSSSGITDGTLGSPYGLTMSAAGDIFVADSWFNRIIKFNSSGVFQGWFGRIGSSPSGGATGCNGAAVGSVTPGWCKGGTSTTGSEEGALNSPYSVTLDSAGALYVADQANSRIVRISPR